MDAESGAARRSRRGGRRAGVSGGSSFGGHSAGASGTSLLHLRRAGSGGRGSSLGSSRAGEVACSSGTVLLDVILVESKGKLLLGGTHAVGTVLAGSSVGSESTAVGVPADSAEELGVLASSERVGHDTPSGIVHAFTEVDISARGKRRSLGGPAGTNCRTALQSSVGGCVGGFVSSSRVDTGDLAGVVLKVGHGADTGGVDNGYQTCRM
jgi:hypothetical protein